jgi:hypothetical protein
VQIDAEIERLFFRALFSISSTHSLIGRELPDVGAAVCVGGQPAVGDHSALRPARGAAGVEDDSDILPIHTLHVQHWFNASLASLFSQSTCSTTKPPESAVSTGLCANEASSSAFSVIITFGRASCDEFTLLIYTAIEKTSAYIDKVCSFSLRIARVQWHVDSPES